MSKPKDQRTHKVNIEKSREGKGFSPEQIREAKNQRAKARNAERRAKKREDAEARNANTPEQNRRAYRRQKELEAAGVK